MLSGQRNTMLHPHIRALVREMSVDDPMLATCAKAAGVIREFVATFGGEPLDLQAIASFRGVHSSTDSPTDSADAEIVPQAEGKVLLSVNHNRPATRKRFSGGHESLQGGTIELDLGSVGRRFAICALTLYTPEGIAGPNGGISVAAFLVPD